MPRQRISGAQFGADGRLVVQREQVGFGQFGRIDFLCLSEQVIAADNQHWVSVIYATEDFSGEPRVMEPEKLPEFGWFLLDAFDIPQTPEHVLLVQVSASIATLLPLTPAGIGTEQAFLLYVFQGTVPSSQLLAFSVGLKFMTVGTNVVAGFTAIAVTLRTVRYKRALESPAAP